MSATADAQIVFLYIPNFWQVKGPIPEEALDQPVRLRRFCAARDCRVINVLPEMRAHPAPDSLYYPEDGHCTETGYALIAEVVVRELEAAGLLPGSGPNE